MMVLRPHRLQLPSEFSSPVLCFLFHRVSSLILFAAPHDFGFDFKVLLK